MKISINKFQVHLKLKREWSAGEKNFRSKIKSELTKILSKNHSPKYFYSISHTEGLGGFALCSGPVGLDIERADRPISRRALERLSTPQEREWGLDPISIWVTKEAAWKALKGPLQPTTISQIEIVKIRKSHLTKNISFTFKVRNSNKMPALGRGRLHKYGRFILGIALIKP